MILSEGDKRGDVRAFPTPVGSVSHSDMGCSLRPGRSDR